MCETINSSKLNSVLDYINTILNTCHRDIEINEYCKNLLETTGTDKVSLNFIERQESTLYSFISKLEFIKDQLQEIQEWN